MIQKLVDARAYISVHFPYLSHAIFSMVPVETTQVSTLAVDRYWRLYYNPDYCRALTPKQLASVLFHEVNHLIRNHSDRFDQLNETMRANIATDLEINDDIRSIKELELPDGAIFPSTFNLPNKLSAEEYFDRLENQVQSLQTSSGDRQESEDGAGESGSSGNNASDRAAHDGTSGTSRETGDSDSSQGGGSLNDSSPRESDSSSGSDPLPGASGPTYSTSPAAGNCGSCAHGKPMPWELDAPNENQPGVTPEQAEVIKQVTAVKIAEHMKNRGNVPAWLSRWAESRLTSKIDWKRELRKLIRSAIGWSTGAVDYTYDRPNRRQSTLPNVVLPRLRAPVPNIAVVVDTSGSMSDNEISEALTEIAAILKVQKRVTVLSVDAQVHAVRKVFRSDHVQLIGGGGTDMERGIMATADLKPAPDVVVVITDGYTPWPMQKPKSIGKVVAVITSRGRAEGIPDWIKTLKIEG